MGSNTKTQTPHASQDKNAKRTVPPSTTALLDDPHNVLFNEKQAADFLGLTRRALQQRRYYSQPPAYIKLPGSSAVRYRLSVLMEFVAQGEVPLP